MTSDRIATETYANNSGGILRYFQYAPLTPQSDTISPFGFENVATIVSIPSFICPTSGKIKISISGYLDGGPNGGTVYFGVFDYMMGQPKYGPTIALTVAANQLLTFSQSMIVTGLTPAVTIPLITVQARASASGIMLKSFDPGGTGNPQVTTNAGEGAPFVIVIDSI